MSTLNLPACELRTAERDGKDVVYDRFRGKYVRLTPEEWVRQHFVHYLVAEHGVPKGLVAIEQPVEVQGQSQRADVVVYDRTATPLLLVECKAPDTAITQDVFDQASRYNVELDAPYLIVTNGIDHYACRINRTAHTITFLDGLPDYEEMSKH